MEQQLCLKSRALWRERVQGVQRASAGSSGASESPQFVGESLQSRLGARIAALDGNDSGQLRHTFVETVLLWEFGQQLARDPAFSEMYGCRIN